MKLWAETSLLRHGVRRCRCGNRHPFAALTHRLRRDSTQTVPSVCRHRCPVDHQGRMRLHVRRFLPLTMGAESAVVVLDSLPGKITSWLANDRPLAKKGEVTFVAQHQATFPRSGFVQPLVRADPARVPLNSNVDVAEIAMATTNNQPLKALSTNRPAGGAWSRSRQDQMRAPPQEVFLQRSLGVKSHLYSCSRNSAN
jgi:hypothetical protein